MLWFGHGFYSSAQVIATLYLFARTDTSLVNKTTKQAAGVSVASISHALMSTSNLSTDYIGKSALQNSFLLPGMHVDGRQQDLSGFKVEQVARSL